VRRLSKTTQLLSALVLLTLLSACGRDEASLVGSLGDFYELHHQEVRARLYPTELAIEFVRENNEVPVRITVLTDPPLEVGAFDLVERGEITGRANGVDIPRYRSGELRLTKFEPVYDSRIKGDFEATFETGKDLASLAGKFDTTLVVIEHVTGYDVDADFVDVAQFRQ